jgi:hypothetical protein
MGHACQRLAPEQQSPERDRTGLFQETSASGVRAPDIAFIVHRSSGDLTSE